MRNRHGASLTDTGILVGLIAVIAILAVSFTGNWVQNTFCNAASTLSGGNLCVATTPGGDTGGEEEPEAPGALTANFSETWIEQPESLTFTVGGLPQNASFSWTIRDGANTVIASDQGQSAGPSTTIAANVATIAPGLATLQVTGQAGDGTPLNAQDQIRVYRLGVFSDALGLAPGATNVTSSAIILEGAAGDETISVSDATLVLDGAPSGASATAHDNMSIALRSDAPATPGSIVTRTLTIGPLTRTWTLGTGAAAPEAESPLILAFNTHLVDADDQAFPLFRASGLRRNADYTWTLTNAQNQVAMTRNETKISPATDNDAVNVLSFPASALGRMTLSATGALADGSTSAADPVVATFFSAGEFTPRVDTELNQIVVSNLISIDGLTDPTPITAEDGILVINDVAAGTSALVTSDDIIALQMTTPATYETEAIARLHINLATRTFSATTRAQFVTPPQAVFHSVTTLPSTAALSNIVGLNGFSGPLSVTISGGTFQLDGAGAWRSSASINPGQRIQLQTTSPATLGSAATVTLSLGGTQATWVVRTPDPSPTPQPFTFAPIVDAAPGSFQIRSAKISTTQEVYVTGSPVIQFRSSSSPAWNSGAFVRPRGTVWANTTASMTFGETKTITVTSGSYSTPWTITTRQARTSPSAFAFAGRSNLAPSTQIESNIVTLTGMEAAGTISVTGGEYRILDANGDGAYQTTSGTVPMNARIQLRGVSPATIGSNPEANATTVAVTIGTTSGSFAITNRAPRTRPDPFVIEPKIDQEFSAVVVSDVVTPTNFEAAAPIAVAGSGTPQISIAGGDWTTSGTLSPGQSFRVRLMSSNQGMIDTRASVNVGGRSAEYVVRTIGGSYVPIGFDFQTVTGADRYQMIYSTAFSVDGISGTTKVYGSVGTNGVQRRENGSWVQLANGVTLYHGDVIRYYATAATALNTPRVHTFIFDNLSTGPTRTWTIITSDGTDTPDSFETPDMTKIGFGEERLSGKIELPGLDREVPISIVRTGSNFAPSYRINGGSWQSAASNVKKNDTVEFRVVGTSSVNIAALASTGSLDVTIGGATYPIPLSMTSGLEPASLYISNKRHVYPSGATIAATSSVSGATGVLNIGPMTMLTGGSDTNMGFYPSTQSLTWTTAAKVSPIPNPTINLRYTPPNYGETRTYRLMVGATPVEFNVTTDPVITPSFSLPDIQIARNNTNHDVGSIPVNTVNATLTYTVTRSNTQVTLESSLNGSTWAAATAARAITYPTATEATPTLFLRARSSTANASTTFTIRVTSTTTPAVDYSTQFTITTP